MSRGTNQKFKFTYLMRIMLAKTDDEHWLNLAEIMTELEKYGVTAERKSLYNDSQDMTEKFGIEIIKEQVGRDTYYHVGAREFELAEVKLLIDAMGSEHQALPCRQDDAHIRCRGKKSRQRAFQELRHGQILQSYLRHVRRQGGQSEDTD